MPRQHLLAIAASSNNLLVHEVDISAIALWLGHESTETTQIYLQADMGLKEQGIANTSFRGGHSGPL